MAMVVNWMQQHVLFMFAILIFLFNSIWFQNFRKDLNMGWPAVFLISLLHCVIGFFSMKLLAIIEVGGNLDKAANMRLFGAVYFLPIFYGLGAKLFHRDISRVFDMAAVSLVIGLVFGRFDCLVAGCCKGTIIPWLTSSHWPIREIELIYYAFFLIYYGKKILHKQTHGEVYPIFMIQYGILRFLLEWFRMEFTTSFGIFHLAHIWCIISFAAGLSIYYELQLREKKVRR